MTILTPRDAAKQKVLELVQNFRRNEADYLQTNYNETQTRTEFITPLLEAFGWDVHNRAGHSSGLREVIEEANVEVGVERISKRPDYELRLARQRKFFVEAKKPSVPIDRHRESAFQTRRYGFSASLPISILTNFYHLAVYDCAYTPDPSQEAHVARIIFVRYDEFETKFDLLWEILSRETVYSGDFDRKFSVGVTRHGTAQFDDLFLKQVKSWRARLARDIHANSPEITHEELTYVVQLFLSRIVFLRICEDRNIERYETLKNLPLANTFGALSTELRRADQFYNSGLFCLVDDERLGVKISDDILHEIIAELYFPQSPYTFAVVEAEVLGEIYEQFLGDEIMVNDGVVTIVNKAEVRESGGVFPTPRFIVDDIVERTLLPAIKGKNPTDLIGFTVADVCCGSGIFLLALYEFLLEHYLAWYLENDRSTHIGHEIYDAGMGQWRLTFSEKRRILLEHIRGVDIDASAVEVAQFSLLLRLLEGEEAISLQEYVRKTKNPALPTLNSILKCGNSLVSYSEWLRSRDSMESSIVQRINPFDWHTEFTNEMDKGGFDVIVGNPPYIRIQGMATYSPEEVLFYKTQNSPYYTARSDNFDKYSLFVERSISLISNSGRCGMIVPHKFMTTKAGASLRELLTSSRYLEQIVHFGVKQVFGVGVSNYTCILVLSRNPSDFVRLERPGELNSWRYGIPADVQLIQSESLGIQNWQFVDSQTQELFDRVRSTHTKTLDQVCEIFVGVQTSQDETYIFKSVGESADFVTLRYDNREWPIEREIVRPCLLDVSFDAYSKPAANAWMIFPYDIVVEDDRERASLIQPEEMLRKYPYCWAYIVARRAELEKRNLVGGLANEKQYYQFGRSQSLTKFNTPKIIFPALSIESKYAYDDANTVVTGGGNGPYYMLRSLASSEVSDLYILSVLNHPLSEAFVRTNTSTFRGGYYAHGKQFIKDLPVPIPTAEQHDRIERKVKEIINTRDRLISARIPRQRELYQRRIDEVTAEVVALVSAIFGLSDEDMRIVLNVPVPT